MRGFIVTLGGILAVLAFSLYAVIGETGPIGWINAAQARNDGTYSRAISAFVLLIAVCLIVLGAVYVVEFFQKLRRAGAGPAAHKPVLAPALAAAPTTFAPTTPAKAPTPAPSGWRMALIVWAVFMSLLWGGLFAWYGWDWHLRRVDIVSAYMPLQLSRGVEPDRPDNGAHLSLQGGALLWDRALSRRTKREGSLPEAIYVPLATADWRQGDPVHFVAQFDSVQQLYDLQRAAGDVGGPVLVRVDGGVPGVTRPVFEQHGVLVADDAVMVTAVMSQAGRPTEADPPFDWMHVSLIGGVVTFMFTVLPLAAALGLKRQAWMKRRREARAAGKGA